MRLPLYSGLVILCRLTPRVWLSCFFPVFFLLPRVATSRLCSPTRRPRRPSTACDQTLPKSSTHSSSRKRPQQRSIHASKRVRPRLAANRCKLWLRLCARALPKRCNEEIFRAKSCDCRNGATRRYFAPRAAIVLRPRQGKRGQARHASLRPRTQGRHTVAWRGRGMFYCRFGCGDMPPTSRRSTGYEWSAA